jgi:hypothetical protein
MGMWRLRRFRRVLCLCLRRVVVTVTLNGLTQGLCVSLRNQDRFFDPRGENPFTRFVVPRRPVRVLADGYAGVSRG